MSRYRLTRRADRNLIDIFLYSAERFGVLQATRYADNLRHVFDLLADNPFMGRAADHVRRGIRGHEHAEPVIFYRQTSDGLLVVGIVHRRMRPDLDADV